MSKYSRTKLHSTDETCAGTFCILFQSWKVWDRTTWEQIQTNRPRLRTTGEYSIHSRNTSSRPSFRHLSYLKIEQRSFPLGQDDNKPIFPLPCRDMIWFEIHELGFAHQFKHNLSYHQSRHTFGTLLVSAGVPMESIAKMMGHTNIRTTQGYAKVTDDKISEDMDRLIEKRGQQQLTNNNASVWSDWIKTINNGVVDI